MDNHPIPQDVTGFKFRLIGTITVKQFAYILVGGIPAYLIFLTPLPFLVKLPLMIIFGALGFGLAFIPIDGRPMDLMLTKFLKAIPADNQYIYRKKGADISLFIPSTHAQQKKEQKATTFQHQTAALPQFLPTPPLELEEDENEFVQKVQSIFEDSTLPATSSTNPTLPTTATDTGEQHSTPTTSTTAPSVSQSSLESPAVDSGPVETTLGHEQTVSSENPSIQPLTTEQPPAASSTLPSLKQDTGIEMTIQSPALQGNTLLTKSPRVKILTGQAAVESGFPTIPDTGNVLLGILKDPREKALENMLVEVYDEHDNPVRTFKTNALGQFRSATTLPSGDYTIKFEDIKKTHEFDTIKVHLDGSVFLPIEVISMDAREKLRQELFSA